ncbi:MAG: acyltransferase [Planctomycetaceae bacterium]
MPAVIERRKAVGVESPATESRPSIPTRRQRLVHLDVLRFVAILLVLGRHGHFEIHPDTWGGGFFATWRHVGWVGVDLFFTLSGFLIGSLLFAELRRHRSLDVKRFLMRRGLKIWPSYAAYLAVTVSIAFLAAARKGDFATGFDRVAAFWPAFLHLQNYWRLDPAETALNATHLWSLAVEEHFYLLLPFCLAGLAATTFWQRHALRTITIFASLFFVGCLAARIVVSDASAGFDKFALYTPTHVRMDSLMAGVLLAAVVAYRRRTVERLRSATPLLLLVGAAGVLAIPLFVPRESHFGHTWGYTLQSAAACVLVLWAWLRGTDAAANDRASDNVPLRWAAAIGAYSYSIYLWHLPYAQKLCDPLNAFVGAHSFGAIAYAICFVAVSVVGGVAAYRAIEYPVLRWRDRTIPGRS